MKLLQLGDSAFLLDFADESKNPEIRLERALHVADAVERARIPGVIDITAAYESVALFLDSTQFGSQAPDNSSFIEQIARAISSGSAHPRSHQRRIEIPVCYDAEFALDAGRVENATNLPIERIIDLHSSTGFTVACLGFMPGFPYLAGLPVELHVSRFPTPRTKVPAGSVAIANAQAGIYPFTSPGGWNIIGRTPLRLFDPHSNPPALLAAGDYVRFRLITRHEFEAIASSNEK